MTQFIATRPLKRKFTPAEDDLLREIINPCQPIDWTQVASHFPNRSGRQCRDRWMNYVNPTIINSLWSAAEERLLETNVQILGSQWKLIAQFLPNRSVNQIKNHWNVLRHRAIREPPASEALFVDPRPRTEGLTPFDYPEFTTELFPLQNSPQNVWETFL
jgi:hypothetical protein